MNAIPYSRRLLALLAIVPLWVVLAPGAAGAAGPGDPVDVRIQLEGPTAVVGDTSVVYRFASQDSVAAGNGANPDELSPPANLGATLQLPAGMTFESTKPGYWGRGCGDRDCSTNDGPCTASTDLRTVTCATEAGTSGGDLRHSGWTVTVRIAPGLPVGTDLPVVATATTTSAQTNTANDSSSIATAVVAGYDLAITVHGPAKPVVAGTSFTFVIEVRNNGPEASRPWVLRESYDSSQQQVTVPEPPTVCFQDPGSLICDFPALAVGESNRLVHTMRTDAAQAGTTIEMGAWVEDFPLRNAPDTANNRVTLRVPVVAPAGTGTGSGGSDAGGGLLPVTGPRTAGTALLGLLLITAGAAVILTTRRRPTR
jgi:hypothetical protein